MTAAHPNLTSLFIIVPYPPAFRMWGKNYESMECSPPQGGNTLLGPMSRGLIPQFQKSRPQSREFANSLQKKSFRLVAPCRIADMDDASPLIRQETMEPGILGNPWIQRQELAPVVDINGELNLVVNLADGPFPLLRFRRDHDHEIKRGAFLRPAIEVGIGGQTPDPTGRALRRINVQDAFRPGVQRTGTDRIHLDFLQRSRSYDLFRQHLIQGAVYPHPVARRQNKQDKDNKKREGSFTAATHSVL